MITSRTSSAHKSLWLKWIASILFVIGVLVDVTCAQECGSQAGGASCQNGYCCSKYGYCGTTSDYCGSGNCQSQCPSSNPDCGNQGSPCANGLCCSKYGYCGSTNDYCGQGNCVSQCPSGGSPPPASGSGVGSIVTSSLFNTVFPNRNSFYTYDAFIAAANSYPSFGTTGSQTTKLREIAAYFAEVSHETSGLVYIREIDQSSNYCDSSNTQYPCVSGQSYYGRGPLQISWNYNYGPAGNAIGDNLLSNPDLVAQDATVSFQTSLWFWQTPQSPIPSCHDVMVGAWTPSQADTQAGRLPGFGLTIDIINGGIECGPGASNPGGAADRITYFKSICSILGVDPGSNLDCQNMQPF